MMGKMTRSLFNLFILFPFQHDLPSHAGPTLREKSLLLSRMMTFYEKRFSDDPELLPLFLDTVLYAFKSVPQRMH